jgi:2-oxoisovalerate dehydrogenase E1 component beta subunit
MTVLTIAEALNLALDHALTEDPDVIILGEDVGANGGVFRITDGLHQKHPNRVLDTPLAESMIAGTSIGMATQGLKPVAEFQFMGFIHPAIDQIINHASRMRNRTRGRLTCPIVFRAPYGGGIRAPEHHSESYEALFAHMPGLRVVIPSSPQKAYGLLLASIRDPDPVIFLEPKRIYRSIKQEVTLNGESLPLDRAFITREGQDITLVTWGAMIKETTAVAEQLADQGISAEIIDLATIKPIDTNTIIESVEKTGRCVIIHEAHRNVGVGAEISAQIMEFAFDALKAPVQRVTGFDTVMPYFKMEDVFLPSTKKIKKVVEDVMETV